jgi:hypothetical protein
MVVPRIVACAASGAVIPNCIGEIRLTVVNDVA